MLLAAHIQFRDWHVPKLIEGHGYTRFEVALTSPLTSVA